MGRPARTIVALVSYRLGGADGVSVEAATWAWALVQLGYAVRTVAGDGVADVLLQGLALDATEGPDAGELAAVTDDAGLAVVENVCSLPLNPAAGEVVANVLRGRPALLRHHDLPWQRERFAHCSGPADDPAWAHVTINDLSRRQLADRGIEATTIYNAFDTEAPLGDRARARAEFGLPPERRLVVQPTRAIARKGVPDAMALAQALGADYWLVGPAEEGYGPELERVLAGAAVPVHRGLADGLTMADAYAASDIVAFPSSWEGFGNPIVESAIHRRPLVVRRYPVAQELAGFGFRWFDLDAVAEVEAWLTAPDPSLLEHNLAVARRHFSRRDLPDRLAALIETRGWPRP